MRRRFLRFLATFTFRWAWLMLPLVIAMTGGAWWLAEKGQIDTSMIAFLPPGALRHHPIGEIVSDYRRLEPIMVLMRARRSGDEAELISATREMARLLNDPGTFSAVLYTTGELAQGYYDSLSDIRLIQLLTPDDWGELERLMSAQISADRLRKLMAYRLNAFIPPKLANAAREDPLGALAAIRNRLASSRGPTRLEARNGYLFTPDGQAMVILLYPARMPEDGRSAVRTFDFLQDTRDFLLARHAAWREAFDIQFEGSMVNTARLINRIEEEQKLILKLALPLVALLILLVFRKVEAILFILLPPLVGLVWTVGLAAYLFNGISTVTAALLLVILAMGLQYNVHLYHRFTMELYRGHNYYRALGRSYVETGRGVLASAVVVALLFCLLLVTSLHGAESLRSAWQVLRDASGFGRLGLVAGMGILCNLAACLLSLPLLASVKHLLARGRIKSVMLYRFGLERFYEPAIANPRATLGVMLLICVFFGYHARELDFYPRFASIAPFFYRAQDEAQDRQAAGSLPRPGRPLVAVVHGKTWQEALERNDRLYENLRAITGRFNILAYDSLRTVLPSLRSQQASLARLNALDLAPLRANIERVSREVGFKPSVYEPFLKAIEELKHKAARAEYLEYGADASETLIATVQRYITRKEDGYYIATAIYPHAGSGFNPGQLGELEAALAAGLDRLDLIGDPLIERELSRMIKFNLAVMALLSILIIFWALILHFRSSRLAWLTFLPVLAELVWLFGLMSLTGVQIHFFTVLVMPLALSLAVDNAMQITQYFHDRRSCTVRHAMASLGRVGMLTCGLTALLYGTVALSTYPGLRDFGAAVLLASVAVLAGTVMLLPALLQLFGRNQPVLATLAEEGEEDGSQ